MSAPQVDRLQALLSRVQVNRAKPRAVTNGSGPRAPQASHSMEEALDSAPGFFAPAAQDSIDTTPPPAAPAPKAQPQVVRAEPIRQEPFKQEPIRQEPFKQEPIRQEPFRQEPARQEPTRTRPAIEAEHVRVPDLKPAPPARLPPQPERPLPAPARPTAPGATPLEMALEGEVARAAESAAMFPPAPVAAAERFELEPGGRVLADPTPPQVSRPIVQAVTKHPPAQPNSFAELLKRSLALRPR